MTRGPATKEPKRSTHGQEAGVSRSSQSRIHLLAPYKPLEAPHTMDTRTDPFEEALGPRTDAVYLLPREMREKRGELQDEWNAFEDERDRAAKANRLDRRRRRHPARGTEGQLPCRERPWYRSKRCPRQGDLGTGWNDGGPLFRLRRRRRDRRVRPSGQRSSCLPLARRGWCRRREGPVHHRLADARRHRRGGEEAPGLSAPWELTLPGSEAALGQ